MNRITMITSIILSLVTYQAAYAADTAPTKPVSVPVATCKDGKTMYGPNASEHRGVCSGHGGVAAWADGTPVKSGRKTEYK